MKPLLVVLAGVLHLVPHPFGVSPVGATALYAGAYGSPRIAWLVPVAILLAGNLIFGFYSYPIVLAFVYAGFALAAWVGRWLLAKQRSLSRYGLAIVAAATLFFLLSNFSIWLVGMYPPTLSGLVQCYVNGIPFLLTGIIADAIFCCLLFGLHHLAEQRTDAVAAA